MSWTVQDEVYHRGERVHLVSDDVEAADGGCGQGSRRRWCSARRDETGAETLDNWLRRGQMEVCG